MRPHSARDRLLHEACGGDLDALRRVFRDAHRRNDLPGLLERLDVASVDAGTWDSLLDLMMTEQDAAALARVTFERCLAPDAPSLKGRPGVQRCLLALCARPADWNRVAAAVAPEHEALSALLERSLAPPQASPLALLFGATRFLRRAMPVALSPSLSTPAELHRWLAALRQVEAHPLAPWVAVEALGAADRIPPIAHDAWGQRVRLCLLDPLGSRLIGPLVQRLLLQPATVHEAQLEWLVEQPELPRRAAEALAVALRSTRSNLRAQGARALITIGAASLPVARALLDARERQTRLAAATVLDALPDRRSLTPLRERLTRERSRPVQAVLRRALAACELEVALHDDPAREPLSDARLDAMLASGDPEAALGLPIDPTRCPALRWRDSAQPLSAPAWRGLVRQAARAGLTPSAGLGLLRARLDPDARAALGRHLLDHLDQWREANALLPLFSLIAALGDEVSVDRLGAQLATLSGKTSWVIGVRGVELLAVSPTRAAAAWLVTWSLLAPLAMRARARLLLERAARLARRPLEEHCDHHAPDHGFSPDGERRARLGQRALTLTLDGALNLRYRDARSGRLYTRRPPPLKGDDRQALARDREALATLRDALALTHQAQAARLEHAMVWRRAWPWTQLTALRAHPIMRALLRPLVFEPVDEAGALTGDPFMLRDDEAPVDAAGAPLPTPAAARLLHPSSLPAARRDDWLAALDAAALTPPFDQLSRPLRRARDHQTTLAALAARPRDIDSYHFERVGFSPAGVRVFCKPFPDGWRVLAHTELVPYNHLCVHDVTFERDGVWVAPPDVDPLIYAEALLSVFTVVT